jgi:hypothetical protein
MKTGKIISGSFGGTYEVWDTDGHLKFTLGEGFKDTFNVWWLKEDNSGSSENYSNNDNNIYDNGSDSSENDLVRGSDGQDYSAFLRKKIKDMLSPISDTWQRENDMG